ncbi:MAG: outer membrane lipoprotein-sorting protein [Chthonomonadales bacterium]|nr:outer membrane lipoprotein-sorting protein [Chthonomonadales bacterium]
MRLVRVLASAAIAIAAASATAQVPRSIQDYVCRRLDDFTVTGVVASADQRELGKINKDFGFLYRFKTVLMRYKEPNKVRIEGSVEGTKGVYILNGSIQIVSIPKLRLNTRRDFGNSPGKRKSLMDMGLVSEYFLTYTNFKFVREGVVEGTPVGVFEVTYKDRDEDTSHHIVYIDPKTRVVRKRDAYRQDGTLQAIYYYRDVKEVSPGIWFPTRIEVQNTDRKLAGSTVYRDFKVNTGLPDNLFQ